MKLGTLCQLAIAASIIVLLSACAGTGGMGYQGMTADQLNALAKMKDASIQCIKGAPPLTGPFSVVLVNVDKGVIPEGGITVSPDCQVTLTNTRVTTTVTTTTTPLAKPAP